MSDSWYDTAQICRNGHLVSEFAVSQPQGLKKFCDSCGAPTISSCQSCHTPIRGHYHVPGVIGFFGFSAPSFCHNCGKEYPWMEATLEAAKELSDELDDLSPEEKETLKKSIDDIVRDTPRTTLAATRFKKLIGKAGKGAAEGFKDILVDVLSESAKKMLWP
jgi:hypothetical protein